jgi:lipopolysaccharide assembly outer membrane protein LptD (OstA)
LFLNPNQDPRVYDYLSRYGDYNNVMAFLFYDDTYFNGRYDAKLGFAYTETGSTVYNREIIYGLGYRIGDNWGAAFEQRYDLEHNQLSMQKYQIRRRLHCWEAALTFRDRQTGWDFGIEFNISALPDTRLRFRGL